jgi:D-alanine-D-alanine ligase-like ATP-grasp enzyme
MKDIRVILKSRPIVFVGTKIIDINRGWEPIDVRKFLESQGVQCHYMIANQISELEDIISTYPNAIYWPVCYNLSNDSSKTSIMKIFESHNLKFVGAGSRAIDFSSKINFKNAVSNINEISTPHFELVNSVTPTLPKNIEFPAMLKTEFSCNSEGVRKVYDKNSFFNANEELRNLYNQSHFVEKWEREKEYTVAYIPASSTRKMQIAPVYLKVLNEAEYIDIPTKANNSLVKVDAISDEDFQDLIDMTTAITTKLNIDGHCRIDYIRNKTGELFVIELNFQPFMAYHNGISYFPNALIKAINLDFGDQIFQILEHALNRNLDTDLKTQ